ncbi:hypothetical protein HMPREF1989_00617 [Porphyromonas gingivalis F0566]|nr:hypothetical protein HMPREF1989_00617 [Porphyromonas gingivalis F0566]
MWGSKVILSEMYLRLRIRGRLSNQKTGKSRTGSSKNTRVKTFVLARKFFSSRTKTKKITNHVFGNHKHEKKRSQTESILFSLPFLFPFGRFHLSIYGAHCRA